MVVYKGTENCTIMKRELQHHHPTCIYETQENAWIDERVMLPWVEDVLAPYVALAPLGRYHYHPPNPSGFILLTYHGIGR